MRVPGWPLLILAAVALALLGCGGPTPGGLTAGDRSEPRIQGEAFPQPLSAAAEAQAQEITQEGRRVLQLSNGLVTALADPASGRLLSLRLGAFEFLRTTVTEGGEEARLALAGNPDSDLPAAAWARGEIVTARGLYAEVKLSAAEESSSLRLTRTLRLYAGSTRLTVTDTVTNAGDQSLRASLRTTAELTGVLASAAPTGQVRLYAPVAPASGHPEGFWSVDPAGDATQFQALPPGRILETIYRGQPGEVAVNLREGWLAYTEAGGNRALVRRFALAADGNYPDGAALRLRTGKAEGGVAYVAAVVSSPVQELRPGATLTLAQDWYATVLPGPIVDTADHAAFAQALTLQPEAEQYRLTGRLGVFSPGTLLISPVDAAGQPLGTPLRLAVTPDQPIELDETLSAGPGAAAVRLALENPSGTPLSTLARVPLPRSVG